MAIQGVCRSTGASCTLWKVIFLIHRVLLPTWNSPLPFHRYAALRYYHHAEIIENIAWKCDFVGSADDFGEDSRLGESRI